MSIPRRQAADVEFNFASPLFAEHPWPMYAYDTETFGIVAANEVMLRAYGYTAREMTAMSVADLRPREEWPALESWLRRRERRAQQSLFASAGRWQHRTRAGEILDVEVMLTRPLASGGRLVRVVAIRDVTEIGRDLRRLARSEALLTRAEEVAGMGIWTVEPDGATIVCSEHLLSLLGIARGTKIGTPADLVRALPNVDAATVRRLSAVMLRRDGGEPVELKLTLADGFERSFEFRSSSIGGDARAVGTMLDVSERKFFQQRLEHLAYYDELTGLANRVQLDDYIERLLHARDAFAVLLVRIEQLHVYNASLGREAGNRILNDVGRHLTSLVPEDGLVARFGGNDFAVVVHNVGDQRAARRVAKTVLESFDEPIDLDGNDIFLMPSIGVALAPSDADEIEPLVRAAETAMRRARAQAGPKLAFYESTMQADARYSLQLESELHRALERHELTLCYQPIVESKSGVIVAAEALLRWHSAALGPVPTNELIAVAERTGLILPIGEWVLREACAQNRRWQLAGFAPIRMTVNVSPRQFQQASFFRLVSSICAMTRLDPSHLELELTESSMVEGFVTTNRTLEQLRRLGVRISVDDFGTGYSSLSYLGAFPLDVVKIDRSFVANLGSDRFKDAIAQAIVTLGHSIGLRVVAEGIETREQYDRLSAMDCDLLQGYFIGKPVDGDAFGERLRGAP